MSFQYACFISYRRHTRTKAFVDRLAPALREELELVLVGEHNKVFRDNDYLRYGDDIEKEIANGICKSVCLLIVYVPNTYQRDYLWCAREYSAMCELEHGRLAGQHANLRPEHGPILTLPYRGEPNTLPRELANRGTYEFDAYKDLANDADLQDLPRTIASDVATWCNYFAEQSTLPADGGCDTFLLPQADCPTVETIVSQQAECGYRFPSQGR